MDNQVDAEILTEIHESHLHQLLDQQKLLQKSGKLRLSKLSETQYCITIDDFIYKFNSDTGLFFKVNNGPNSSFFFTPDGETLLAITIDRYKGSNQFEDQINKLTEIYTYEKAKSYHVFQKLVQKNYPNPDIPIIETGKVSKFIEKCGDFVGNGFMTMGNWSASAVNYVGQMVQSKLSPGDIDENKKEKLEALSQKTKSVQNTVSSMAVKVSQPIIQKGSQISNKISHSMQTSQYAGVKTLNDIANSSLKASGSAISGFWNGLCTFGKAVSTQTKNIWNKKFNSQNVVEMPSNRLNEQSLPQQITPSEIKEEQGRNKTD